MKKRPAALTARSKRPERAHAFFVVDTGCGPHLHPRWLFAGGDAMDRSNRRIATLMGFALLLTASAAARAEDWPMYGRDLKHSFTNSAALINASNVATLLP